MTTLRIGTRGSKLALLQAEWVTECLRKIYPDISIETVTIQTKGDLLLEVPLSTIGNKGFFTDEIEASLLNGTIDIAVHSLKDLPTKLPQGLTIGAYCEREDPRDVFISKEGRKLNNLPPHSQIGTSSLRRKAQLLRLRPDLCCVDIRGNVDTRIRKLKELPELAGIILAAAGVRRMGQLHRITQYLRYEDFLPAPGQGVIALEIATERKDVRSIVAGINHEASEYEARAERQFLYSLDGGCQVPIGARAVYTKGMLGFHGMVASLDGSRVVKVATKGTISRKTDAEVLGCQTAGLAIRKGAAEILSEFAWNKQRASNE